MELKEIDPELFISCRLCADNKGVYQIIPTVQEQIKYSVDITVDQFDGFPQLLCRNCNIALNYCYDFKRKCKARQDTLIRTKSNKIIKTSESEEKPTETENHKTTEKVITESVPDSGNNKVVNVETVYVKKISKRRILSSSSSSGDEFQTKTNTITTQNRQEIVSHKTKAGSWQSNYTKHFICRYCKRKCDSLKSVQMHISEHKTMLKQAKILTKHCRVTLNIFDYQPNFTRQDDIVALDKHNYIQDDKHLDYYIRYIQKGQPSSSDETSEPYTKETLKSNTHEYPEVISSGEESLSKFKLKKRLRIVTRNSSSTDTIPIDPENEKDNAAITDIFEDESTSDSDDKIYSEPVTTVTDFINIDDTSTEAPDNISISKKDTVSANENYALSNQNVKIKATDYKTITNIISISFNKHLKKVSQNPNKESLQKCANNNLLNRKLLSIGRKIMSKNGIVSTTLLKYLQKKNLQINWVPSNKLGHNAHTSKEIDYVRILTKVRDTEEEDNLTGFQILNDDFNNKLKPTPSTASTAVLDDLKNKMENLYSDAEKPSALRQALISKDTVAKVSFKRDQVLGPVIEVNADSQSRAVEKTRKDKKPHRLQIPNPTDHLENQATLLINSQLLNANPVANPKQAPKKKCSLEQSSQKTVISDKAEISKTTNDDCIYIESDDEEDKSDSNLMLPIITSTTSLVEGYQNEKPDTNSILENGNIYGEKNKKDTMPIHRIKCKPVSELMSETALNNLKQNNEIPQNHIIIESKDLIPFRPSELPTNSSAVLHCDPSANYANSSVVNVSSESQKGQYAIMNSPSLPHTQTISPFSYFKGLLNSVALNFLPVNSSLNKNFICLVSFKLEVRQEENVILLYLSLHGFGNEFCLKIKGVTQSYIVVENISAQWEWEVLKAFQDDVVTNKILECAQKFDPILHKHAKEFLVLLKSIECQIIRQTST